MRRIRQRFKAKISDRVTDSKNPLEEAVRGGFNVRNEMRLIESYDRLPIVRRAKRKSEIYAIAAVFSRGSPAELGRRPAKTFRKSVVEPSERAKARHRSEE